MSPQNPSLHERRLRHLALLLLGVGLVVRGSYYLGDPSLWWDETAIMLNVQEKDCAGLAGPLLHAQSGPPFFLWLEKGLVTWLGDSPWVWRAPALAASCLGLLLLWWVARRLLPAAGAAWAVGLFAFSDRLLWHTVEVKPYTLDTLAAVAVLAAWLRTDAWQPVRRILLFALLCPPLCCLSYPALFVCSGPAGLLLWDAWRGRRLGIWFAYGLYLGVLAGAAAWLVQGPIRGQQQGLLAAGFDWANHMPDWGSLAGACAWPLKAAFEVLRYCLRPTGGLLLGVAVVGAFRMVQRRQHRPAVVLLAPLLAAMVAAGLHRYPCGCARPMLFMTPAAALLIGGAVPPLLRRCRPSREAVGCGRAAWPPAWQRWSAGVAGVTVLTLALAPMGLSLYRLAVPWVRADCRGAAEYVLSHRRPDDLVVMTSWDQLYFYRGLAPRCCRGREGLGEAHGSRCWVTLGYPPYLAVDHGAPPGWTLTGRNAWAVVERKAFGELTLVLLERPPSGEASLGR